MVLVGAPQVLAPLAHLIQPAQHAARTIIAFVSAIGDGSSQDLVQFNVSIIEFPNFISLFK